MTIPEIFEFCKESMLDFDNSKDVCNHFLMHVIAMETMTGTYNNGDKESFVNRMAPWLGKKANKKCTEF